MFYDVILIASIVLYVVALSLLALAHRWDDQADQFTRVAGIIGLVAGLATLVQNVLMVSAEDLFETSIEWLVLLLLAVSVPVLVIAGAILTLKRRRGGVPMLTTGLILWLLISGLGVVVSLKGGI